MKNIDLLQKNIDLLNEEFKIVSKQLKEENEGFFKSIIEHHTNLIIVVQAGAIAYINPAGLSMLQVKSSAEIMGRNLLEIVNPVCHHQISDRMNNISGKSGETIRVKFEGPDQTVLDYECTLSSFLFKGNEAILVSGRSISQEVREEMKIQLKEKLQTDILNAFQEVIAFYGPDHSIIWLNDAGKKQLNIQDDSYIGNLCYKVWFKSDKPCKTCPVVTRKIESQERIITFEDKHIWKIRNTPLFDNKGTLTGYIEYRTDITEKQTIKRELKKSHALQIRAEISNYFGHIEIDLLNDTRRLSPGALNILGLQLKNKQAFSEVDFFEFVHSDDLNEVAKYLNLAYSGKKKFDRIFRIVDENCNEKTIHGIGEITTDPVSENRTFFLVIQDITKLSNLETLVFNEKEKYKLLAENAPFGLLLTLNNIPVYINKTLVEWFGISSIAEIEERGLTSFFHPDDNNVANRLSEKIRENNIPSLVIEKLRFLNHEGNISYVRIELSNNLIHNQNYIQIVFTDITNEVIQEKKQKQIAADTLYIHQKNSILSEIENELENILSQNKYSKSIKEFDKIYSIINSYKLLDKDWKMLVTNFEEVHPGFIPRLKTIYPMLSTTDIKHCTCIKMNMDTKEIARFFNIKMTSVQIARVRIKKKMNLAKNIDLRSHIISF